MKKYISSICALMLGFVAFTACSDEEGTIPGGDSQPAATVYTYSVSTPYNPDNDLALRIVANNQTTDVFYMPLKVADIEGLSENEVINRVVSEGTKVELKADSLNGGKFADIMATGMFGDYLISVVAQNGSQKILSQVPFTGLDWSDVCTGTWYFASKIAPAFGVESLPTTLQVCTTDENLFRLKDVFGAGYSMKIQRLDIQGEDEDGVYSFLRVPVTATPYEYGDYGPISLRDIGYWQNNDAWVTDNGYESGMYADYTCFFIVQYYVTAGSLGYNFYNYFIPD